jgi:hypothetical protein
VKKKQLQLRCSACTRRIKDHHPHVGLINLETGREIAYHARCQKRAAVDFVAMAERGKAYVVRHYHGAVCPDETPGWDCAGGCFTAPGAVAN